MIIPIPADQIAFSEIVPRKIKVKTTPKITAPAIEVPVQVAVPSSPKATPDVKGLITVNQILAITLVLAVIVTVIYLINKHQEDKAEKVQLKMY